MDANKTYKLGSLTLVIDPKFLIARGSDGTQVFLSLRDDSTEVAVKRIDKFNYQDLKNEEEFLRFPELDSPFIVRYVDFAEDHNFGYLALQLCEYTLEEYIQKHLPDDNAERILVLKKLVKEVLCSLQVLHQPQTKVLHRDIKPQNVLIDIKGKAKLADFGISRRLKQGETTIQTVKLWNIHPKLVMCLQRMADKEDAVKINLMSLFPDLFGSVYLFAKEKGWHTRESVMMDINSAS
ncbi:hypothetical protein ABG768_025794 [Culter alburnus]|uniref:Protein kinase domain-containing protein n=1 Tax=Culter alburnus TaxID=194366 RepID=A0AAW2AIL7_CULAL